MRLRLESDAQRDTTKVCLAVAQQVLGTLDAAAPDVVMRRAVGLLVVTAGERRIQTATLKDPIARVGDDPPRQSQACCFPCQSTGLLRYVGAEKWRPREDSNLRPPV